MKKCKSCNETLPYNNFTKSKIVKDGYENKCKKCRQEQRKKYTRKCISCGDSFKSENPNTNYCSNQCIAKGKELKVRKSCKYCNVEYSVVPSRIDTSKYCSVECRYEGQKAYGENNLNYNRLDYSCDGCGTAIKVTPIRIKDQKYIFCNNECYKSNIGKYFSGPNNYWYSHELTDEEREIGRNYTEYRKWRTSVYERDNYRCVICEDKDGGLNAHHLFNYASHRELRTDVNNGVTLCKTCHRGFHSLYGFLNNTKDQFDEYSYIKQANIEPSVTETLRRCND